MNWGMQELSKQMVQVHVFAHIALENPWLGFGRSVLGYGINHLPLSCSCVKTTLEDGLVLLYFNIFKNLFKHGQHLICRIACEQRTESLKLMNQAIQ